MGVRFECPSGHKLHVKAHLAGQRGICPECGAKFVVPSFSGGRVAAAVGDSVGPGGDVSATLESSVSFNAGLSQSLPPPTAGEAAAWYVRPAAGGQFGPVDTDSFRQWIDQGRVPDDALVWRNGWSQWKRGVEAVRELRAQAAAVRATPPPPPKTAAPALAFDVGPPIAIANGQAPMPRPVDAIYAARRRRRQVNARMTLVLGVLSIVLLVVLLYVLTR